MAEAVRDEIEFEVVTPERLVFSGKVSEVTVPGAKGYFGILPGHAPLLSELQIGVVSCRQGTESFHVFCGWGFVEVLPDRVSVLAEIAEPGDQIDVPEARADKEQAEQTLESGERDVDYDEAMKVFQQSLARLEAADRSANP